MARRRGRQRGYLREEGGWWVGRWKESIIGDGGERVWKTRRMTIAPRFEQDGSKITRTEAQRRFDRLVLDDIETMNLHPESSITVVDFWEQRFRPSLVRLKLRQHGKLKGRNEHYEYLFGKHILPVLGGERLRDLDFEVVERFLIGKLSEERAGGKTGYSKGTVLHLRNALGAMLRYAKRLGWYAGDLPTEGVDLGGIERRRRGALTWEQGVALLRRLPSSPFRAFRGSQRFVPVWHLVFFLLHTGARIGEALGLRWRRVHLGDQAAIIDQYSVPPRAVLICEAYKDGAYTSPKTGASHRIEALPDALIEALRWLKEVSPFPGSDDPVFAGPEGRPIDAHNLAHRVLKPIGRELGIHDLSWHVFRHTANTWCGQERMSLVNRKKAFGWSEDRMAMHYDHESLEEMRGAMNRVAERLAEERRKA